MGSDTPIMEIRWGASQGQIIWHVKKPQSPAIAAVLQLARKHLLPRRIGMSFFSVQNPRMLEDLMVVEHPATALGPELALQQSQMIN
ncbi:hypothetical protein [Devosia nitrariae]|uniref:hypothetical protein n=1 Tax=Devosia nitrariae TaxID=2071872 RepID=UPI0024E0EF86|nr:hypothetical protein [Devosia nitrariae]